MSSTIAQNPYTAILQVIWSVTKFAQGTTNTLGNIQQRIRNYEYNIDSGAANPVGLLHPKEWGCGVNNFDDKHLCSKLADIQAACIGFDVLVTGEEVEID